ncbi:hypothetical protein KBC51_03750 [Candidatus Saccharibacteria bacterium]|nr:hypothetical protein [Candidatus Saccharibacteria bacterium]
MSNEFIKPEPNKEKDNNHYLSLLRQEIDWATENGKNKDIVYLHGCKLFNTRVNREGAYEIERLIPPYDKLGEFPSKVVYCLAENSTSIFRKEWLWDGNPDGVRELATMVYDLNENVENISRFVLDGLRLDEEESQKYLKKHRKIMNQHYGEDHELKPGIIVDRVGRLIIWMFGPPPVDENNED